MIWSLTPFFNEVDILEIRLGELAPVVDRFVIAEATHTFAGNEKPLYFERHKNLFAPWMDKITYVVVDDLPQGDDAKMPHALFQPTNSVRWMRENMQREALIRGCDGMDDYDLVLLSDVDEIPAAREVVKADNELDTGEIWTCRLPQHVMYLNWRWHESSTIAVCRFTDGRTLKQMGPQKVRESNGANVFGVRPPERVLHGWHFSYMGGPEMIRHKILNAAHHELAQPRWTNVDRIRDRMERGYDMFGRIDRTCYWVPDVLLPDYVQQNSHRFEHLLIKEPA